MHSIGANAADATSRRALNWSPKVCRKSQAVLGHRVPQNWYSIIRRAMHPPNFICIDSRWAHAMRGFELSYATDAAYRDRCEEDGVEGLRDGRLGKPSPKRVPAGVGGPRFKAFGERPRQSPTAGGSILYRLRAPMGAHLF